jgi:hypothetical protein
MAQFDILKINFEIFIYIFIYIVPDKCKSNLEKSILICFLCTGFQEKDHSCKTS